MNVTRTVILSCIVCLLLANVGRADWSMTNMFSPSQAASKSASKKSGLKKSRKPAAKPGVMNTLTSGPKKIYTSTKSLVTPSKKSAAPTKRQTNNWATSQTSQKNTSKPTGFKSWFVPEEKPLPRTVGEWVQQKRIDP